MIRIRKSDMKCGNCNHITRIMASSSGKYYCKNRDIYVDLEDYCTHYNME